MTSRDKLSGSKVLETLGLAEHLYLDIEVVSALVLRIPQQLVRIQIDERPNVFL